MWKTLLKNLLVSVYPKSKFGYSLSDSSVGRYSAVSSTRGLSRSTSRQRETSNSAQRNSFGRDSSSAVLRYSVLSLLSVVCLTPSPTRLSRRSPTDASQNADVVFRLCNGRLFRLRSSPCFCFARLSTRFPASTSLGSPSLSSCSTSS